MSALKAEMALRQVTKDTDFPPKPHREGGDVAPRNSDDEIIALLREIAAKVNQSPVARWQDNIKFAITVLLCLVTLAGAFAVVVGNNSKYELKLQQAETDNLKLWQRVEAVQLQIEDINKRDAVRKALEDAKKGK